MDTRGDGLVGGSSGTVDTTEAGEQPSTSRGNDQLRDLNGSLAGLASSELQGDGVNINLRRCWTPNCDLVWE